MVFSRRSPLALLLLLVVSGSTLLSFAAAAEKVRGPYKCTAKGANTYFYPAKPSDAYASTDKSYTCPGAASICVPTGEANVGFCMAAACDNAVITGGATDTDLYYYATKTDGTHAWETCADLGSATTASECEATSTCAANTPQADLWSTKTGDGAPAGTYAVGDGYAKDDPTYVEESSAALPISLLSASRGLSSSLVVLAGVVLLAA